MLGKNIKQIRRDNKLTQEEFGKKILHTKSTISKWENDQATPDIATLKKISELFDVDLNSLIKDMDTSRKASTKKAPSKSIFKWNKANYSGNKNIQQKSKGWVFHVSWISGTLLGLGLMIIPLVISQDGYGMLELILTLVGMIILIVTVIVAGVLFWRSNKKSFANRWNIKFELKSDRIRMISVKTSGTKDLFPSNILNVEAIGQGSETQVKIHLDNEENIKLFDVDQSVYKRLLIFMKGGSNEK